MNLNKKPDFKEYFSFENYIKSKELFSNIKNGNGVIEFSREFGTYLKSFLEEMKKSQLLKVIEGQKGHRISFVDSWNAFVLLNSNLDYDPEYNWDFISSKLSYYFFENTSRSNNKENSEYTIYEKIIEAINKGNIPEHEIFPFRQNYCEKTGEFFNLRLKNWHPDLYNNNSVLCDVPDEEISHLEIEFKTSEILIADWFRIQEFTNIVNSDEKSISVNSDIGQVEKTKYYLEKFGFISVCVDNTSPSILNVDGSLVFSQVYEECENEDGILILTE